MCLSPIKIPNPYYGIGRVELGHFDSYIEVPCGRCEECQKRKQHDLYVRNDAEYKHCLDNDGIVLMGTFTFNNEHLPSVCIGEHEFVCFDKSLVQMYLHRLNMYARRRLGYKLKYLITSEYGETTHRPHHHGILYFYPLEKRSLQTAALQQEIDTKKLIRECTRDWFKIVDGVKTSIGFTLFKPCDGKGGIRYVTKYVLKDSFSSNLRDYFHKVAYSYLQDAIKQDIKDAPSPHPSELISRFPLVKQLAQRNQALKDALDKDKSDNIRRLANQFALKLEHLYMPFTLQSQGIGASLDLSKVDMIANPVVEVGGYTYALPRYYYDRQARQKIRDEYSNVVYKCYPNGSIHTVYEPLATPAEIGYDAISKYRQSYNHIHFLETLEQRVARLPESFQNRLMSMQQPDGSFWLSDITQTFHDAAMLKSNYTRDKRHESIREAEANHRTIDTAYYNEIINCVSIHESKNEEIPTTQ